ncbi:hypothetical protein QTP70_019714 [Hemibagrus guttatus]|uniref:RRM domain-containing protein n=1 Tax=Hemibagrus guttatus TaxID=175788 RepID=A0AAE0RJM8_9TELE|nr:hypothetical protein QTP70_019714 [Hemibagrus guttatus]
MRVMWSHWELTMKNIVGSNIFNKNLDESINSVALFDTFYVFGRIVSCKVVDSKGYGYIQYESVEQLNGKQLNNHQV